MIVIETGLGFGGVFGVMMGILIRAPDFFGGEEGGQFIPSSNPMGPLYVGQRRIAYVNQGMFPLTLNPKALSA